MREKKGEIKKVEGGERTLVSVVGNVHSKHRTFDFLLRLKTKLSIDEAGGLLLRYRTRNIHFRRVVPPPTKLGDVTR